MSFHTLNMNSKLYLLLTPALLAGSIAIIAGSQSSSRQPPRTIDTIVGVVQTVSYQGVTFSLDRSLAEGATPLTIPASTEGKPSDVWPDHVGFSLTGYPRPRSLPAEDPHIRVF